MGCDYKFYCNQCNKTGGGFSSQAWGTGNAYIIDSFRFLMKHRYCRKGFDILEEQYCYEIDTDRDESLLGYFPHSEEWKKEISDKEYQKYLEYCNKDRIK